MRRAALVRLPLRRKAKRVPAVVAVTDLVKRDFYRDGPNQLWVTDITEHSTREGNIRCCVVLDAYSRRMVGWAHRFPATCRSGHCRTRDGHRLPQHRWPGAQKDHSRCPRYAVDLVGFTECARRAGLLPLLRKVGDPYDNAVAEAFWGRMQTELLDWQRRCTRVELANARFECVEGFYNRRPRHSARAG